MPILYLEAGSPPAFPPTDLAEEGLLCVGGDLDPRRVLAAYDLGIFPWYGEDEIPLWWCPDPRGVLPAENLHVSRSLNRVLRARDFRLTWNACFGRVMRACSLNRPDGVWIHEEMIECYLELHAAGHAHSLEVWHGDELVGGIYGVQRGAVFAAESKFHAARDMSKVALVALVRSLHRAGIRLFDVQFQTPHLERLGVVEWSRARYLQRLAALKAEPVSLASVTPTIDR